MPYVDPNLEYYREYVNDGPAAPTLLVPLPILNVTIDFNVPYYRRYLGET